MIEPVPVDDDLCTALATIEDLGHAARFVFNHQQVVYENGGEEILVVKAKIVLPYPAIRPFVRTTLGFLGRRGARTLGKGFLQLVK